MKRVILITGASSGMGKDTALRLIQEGNIVYGGARRIEKMQEIVDAGGYALSLDVTNLESVNAAVQKVLAEQNRIDVLWNNAGYSLAGAVENVSYFEKILKEYYASGQASESGVPSVTFIGKEMRMSPYYLSDLLKKETGRNTIEHIHFYIIDRAKSALLGTNQSVSEIAYNLGFEYPQHFAKVFKNKTGSTPSQYRKTN